MFVKKHTWAHNVVNTLQMLMYYFYMHKSVKKMTRLTRSSFLMFLAASRYLTRSTIICNPVEQDVNVFIYASACSKRNGSVSRVLYILSVSSQ